MNEVELGAMRTFATGNNPDYIRIQQLLGGLRAQLSKIDASPGKTAKIPEAGLEYIRKTRDLKYAETIFELLAKQFEDGQNRRSKRKLSHPGARQSHRPRTKVQTKAQHDGTYLCSCYRIYRHPLGLHNRSPPKRQKRH